MILQARGLRKEFDGFVAVSDVDLDVQEGSIHAMIGPNGAGKTTLFNMLTGHLAPTRGTITFAGREITHLPAHTRCLQGLVRSFQRTHIFPRLTVFENVQAAVLSRRGRRFSMVRPARGLYRDEVEAILADVGLSACAGELGGLLSHGDQKRLELGIVLALAPRILLLDEPTAGMAPREKFATMELITRIVRERGLTLFFTEHDMDVVFSNADRITVLHQGRVIADGPPAAIRADQDVQRVYFGDAEWLWKSLRSTPSTG
ncbi:MAG: ABC transporter ATP-binding protein [Chloroflexota bacterium]